MGYIGGGGGGGGSSNTQADVTHNLVFPALGLTLHNANFPQLQEKGSTAKVMVASFDQSTQEYGNCGFTVPQDLDTAGTVTFVVKGFGDTGVASKNTAWDFDHKSMADGEAYDAAYTTESSGDKASGSSSANIDVITWTETVSNLAWTAGDRITARWSRKAASANNLAEDYHVIQFELRIPVIPGLS